MECHTVSATVELFITYQDYGIFSLVRFVCNMLLTCWRWKQVSAIADKPLDAVHHGQIVVNTGGHSVW